MGEPKPFDCQVRILQTVEKAYFKVKNLLLANVFRVSRLAFRTELINILHQQKLFKRVTRTESEMIDQLQCIHTKTCNYMPCYSTHQQ
jgi:hypothetical protein